MAIKNQSPLNDIFRAKEALNSEYLSSLTQTGTFLTPRLNAEDLVANVKQAIGVESHPAESHPKAPSQIRRSGWQVRKARPSDRFALGVAKAGDGSAILALKLEREDGEAMRFGETLREIVPTARVEHIGPINTSGHTEGIEAESIEETHSPLRSKVRPLRIGLSVGGAESGGGSIGPFVESNARGDEKPSVGFLASIDALTRGDSPEIGAPIYQPGRADVPRLEPEYQIGTVSNFAVLSRSKSNLIASALVRIDPLLCSGVLGNVISGQVAASSERRIKGVSSDPLSWIGARVVKIGRSTGRTVGVVSVVEIDSLSIRIGRSIYLFDGVIEIESSNSESPFAVAGDSGSLVFLEDSELAIGTILGFAETTAGPRIYATRLDHSLAALEVRLL
jgi:hypothetical protein